MDNINELIGQIVEMDRTLRTKVSDSEAELQAVRTEEHQAEAVRSSGREKAQQEAEQILEQARKAGVAAEQKAEAEAEHEIRALRKIFDAHRADWVRQIVQRCVSTEER